MHELCVLTAPNIYTENEPIAKYEIMDGAPVRGESIPIRLFLAGYDLTPTMRDINKKFSVRYYLNLVLVDEEERRYFKQQVRMNCNLLIFRTQTKLKCNLVQGKSKFSIARPLTMFCTMVPRSRASFNKLMT